jgi:hypothetical protein
MMAMRPIYILICKSGKIFSVETPAILEQIKRMGPSFLVCNAGDSEKLPKLVIGSYRSPHCFKNIKKLSTKYDASTILG